jgi:hypothetical protein
MFSRLKRPFIFDIEVLEHQAHVIFVVDSGPVLGIDVNNLNIDGIVQWALNETDGQWSKVGYLERMCFQR